MDMVAVNPVVCKLQHEQKTWTRKEHLTNPINRKGFNENLNFNGASSLIS